MASGKRIHSRTPRDKRVNIYKTFIIGNDVFVELARQFCQRVVRQHVSYYERVRTFDVFVEFRNITFSRCCCGATSYVFGTVVAMYHRRVAMDVTGKNTRKKKTKYLLTLV